MPRERILVIDDSPTLQNLVQLVLTKADFEVLTPEGRSAATALREERPDVVLLGRQESRRVRDEFFFTLRGDEGLRRVPIVTLDLPDLAVDDSPQEREIVNALSRPFSPDALLAVVEHVVRVRRDPAAPRPANDVGSLSLLGEEEQTAPGATLPDGALAADLTDGAALAGDLALVSLADILGLLEAEAQTGTLSIRRGRAQLRVHFSDGRIDLATADGVAEEFLLGRFLVRGGALTAATLQAALAARENEGLVGERPLLGSFLVSRGFLAAPALRRVLALQTAALVFESLRWGAGRFAFVPLPEADLPEPAREAALALPVPPLLLEGFRRVDEWRLIEREVGDFDGIFLRDEDRLEAFGRARLTREEVSVLELCDGRRSVREVIERSQLGAFDTTKMIYRLSRSRLVRRRVAPVAMPA